MKQGLRAPAAFGVTACSSLRDQAPSGLDQRHRPTGAALLDLAERCEAASESDRELDAEIAVAVHRSGAEELDDPREFAHARPVLISHGARPGDYEVSGFSGVSLHTAPEFTASIDVAMTLVPEGMILRSYMATRFVPHGAEVGLDWAHGGWIGESDHSFAGALCAAALRARAASVDTRPQDEDPLGASLASGAVPAEEQADAQPRCPMTNRTTEEIARGLTELAERCEKATRPDWLLDADIQRLVRPIDVPICAANIINYTSSLDAAMTLVPEGWRLRQMDFSGPCADDRKWHLNLHGGREGEDTFVGRGAIPALALTAACLRALAVRSHLESHPK